jgi:hypothetical protein
MAEKAALPRCRRAYRVGQRGARTGRGWRAAHRRAAQRIAVPTRGVTGDASRVFSRRAEAGRDLDHRGLRQAGVSVARARDERARRSGPPSAAPRRDAAAGWSGGQPARPRLACVQLRCVRRRRDDQGSRRAAYRRQGSPHNRGVGRWVHPPSPRRWRPSRAPIIGPVKRQPPGRATPEPLGLTPKGAGIDVPDVNVDHKPAREPAAETLRPVRAAAPLRPRSRRPRSRRRWAQPCTRHPRSSARRPILPNHPPGQSSGPTGPCSRALTPRASTALPPGALRS